MSTESSDEAADGLSKFYVRLIRPRFELMVVEVAAADHEEAKAIALEEADQAVEDDWELLGHDSGIYGPHVQSCTSCDDIEAASDDGTEQAKMIEDVRKLEADDDYNYVLLLADMANGEGQVVWERWLLFHEPELLESDLLDDWISALSEVRERSPSFDGPTPEMVAWVERLMDEAKKRRGG